MSVPSESNGGPTSPQQAAGLLSSLPRTRPQRSTPRRTAARGKTAAESPPPANDPPSASAPVAPRSRPAKRAKAKSVKATAAATKPSARKAARKTPKRPAPSRASAVAPEIDPVPAQGFEAESDHARGAVHPPSGAEIVGSATEILGELAKAGISAGERLLKDVLSRLPLS